MRKILVSIAMLGGLALASPVVAQRANPIHKAEYKHYRSENRQNDRDGYRQERGGGGKQAHKADKGRKRQAKLHARRHHKRGHGKHAQCQNRGRKVGPRGTNRH